MWFARHRSLLAPLLSLLCLASFTNGLHESDVGAVDWHKRLIGVPLITGSSSSTTPAFHNVNGTTLVLTATVNNVLAALHPDNGSVGTPNTVYVLRNSNLFCPYRMEVYIPT